MKKNVLKVVCAILVLGSVATLSAQTMDNAPQVYILELLKQPPSHPVYAVPASIRPLSCKMKSCKQKVYIDQNTIVKSGDDLVDKTTLLANKKYTIGSFGVRSSQTLRVGTVQMQGHSEQHSQSFEKQKKSKESSNKKSVKSRRMRKNNLKPSSFRP